MKTYKPNIYGFSVRSFGLLGKTYLATTIMVYFDLLQAGNILTEQQLWTELPDQLGSDTLPDMGFPKPHGEVLVTGSCFARTSEGVQASEVNVKVGALQKRLLIFGDRFWKAGNIPSQPKPFTEMPITWNNSFGGPDYAMNPLGKGVPAHRMDGPVPLPNIESPDQLIGSPDDRPLPAGMAPLDMMWPQRQSKGGTYDNNWKEECWPWFPDDLNPEFFNAAPEDQYIQGFFNGREDIELHNMHPEMETIYSSLPAQRPRCFITRKKTLAQDAATEFVEVNHKIDTVWLFPSILRGLLLFRGTIEILDDEYADIERIYVAAESADEPEKSIEHYYEEQKKFWNRTFDIDMAPFEAAQKKVADTLKKARQAPKMVEYAKLKATGKAPRMHRTVEEIIDRGRKTIAESRTMLAKQETMARKMQSQYGHLVYIDLKMFDRMRKTLDRAEKKLEKALSRAQQVLQKKKQASATLADYLKKQLTPQQLAEAGIDTDDLLPPQKINPWHDRGFPLVIQWRKNLEQDSQARTMLHRLGFADYTLKRGWFGIINQNTVEDMSDWGETQQQIELPAGIVLPRFHEATLVSVRIRPGNPTVTDKDIIIPGSGASPLFLAATDDCAPIVHVQDEMLAWLVEQEIGDVCSVLAMTSDSKELKETAAEALSNAPQIISVLHDTGDGTAGRELENWQKIFGNVTPAIIPAGKSLYDIHQEQGIRNFLMQFLPEDVAMANNIDISLPKPGKPPGKSPTAGLAIPRFDVKSMAKEVQEAAKAHHQSKFDRLKELKKEITDRAGEAIVRAGKDPDQILRSKPEKKSLEETGKKIAAQIVERQQQLRAAGALTPEQKDSMEKAASRAIQLGRDGDRRFQEGMKKLEAAKKEIAQAKAGQIPDSLKEYFANSGIDPDKMRKLTREEVQAMHEKGMSLAGANISGVDLSGLDLSNADFTTALCIGTIFKKCNLQNARFDQTMAGKADFSEADLRGATVVKSLMGKARFCRARLERCEISQSILKEADLTEACLRESRIYMSILKKAVMDKAILDNADIEMSVLSDANAPDTTFSGARLKKCLLKRTALDRTDFSGASFPSTLLHGAHGEQVNFSHADWTKGRMGGEAEFPEADFRNIVMDQGSFMDSKLPGADFSGAVISNSIVENCDLSKANLADVSAKATRFKGSNLEGACMVGMNLFCGSLKKARLVNSDLSFANLFGVDFFKCIMGNTNLYGANLKRTLLYNRTEYLK